MILGIIAYDRLFEAPNPVRQLDQAPQLRILAVPLRARLLQGLAFALATPPPPPGNLPPGRLLLPAPMPGDRPHQPTLPAARDGSIAAAPQSHSSRASHGRPRQAYLRRSPRRTRSPAPRPLRKNR